MRAPLYPNKGAALLMSNAKDASLLWTRRRLEIASRCTEPAPLCISNPSSSNFFGSQERKYSCLELGDILAGNWAD